jgi:hypothetical protein
VHIPHIQEVLMATSTESNINMSFETIIPHQDISLFGTKLLRFQLRNSAKFIHESPRIDENTVPWVRP